MFVEIVTPEGTLLKREVDSVVLPTANGEVGILPGHIPLVTKIERGALQLIVNGVSDLIAVDKGFAEVIGDRVAVLTEGAVDIAEIDSEAIEKAQNRAIAAIEDAKSNDVAEVEALETRIQFLMAQKLMKSGR